MSASPRASLTVTTPPVALVPGRSETVTVMVVNQGGQAEEFRLGVRGIEPGWVTFRPPSLSLGPGEQGTIAVLVQPPPTAAPSTVAPVLRLSARSTGMTVAETPLTTAMAGQAVTMNNLATPTIGGAAAAQAGAARSGSPRWLLPLLAVGTLVCLGLLALGGVAYFRSAAPEPTVTVRVVRLTATVPVAARGTANPGTVPTDTTASAITPVATVAGASVPGSAVAGRWCLAGPRLLAILAVAILGTGATDRLDATGYACEHGAAHCPGSHRCASRHARRIADAGHADRAHRSRPGGHLVAGWHTPGNGVR